MAIACAAIERLGERSPASLFAENTFLLRDLADLLFTGVTRILVCGGSRGESSDSVEILDIAENRWEAGPKMPIVLDEHDAALADGRIVVVGGYGEQGRSNRVFAFDVEKGTWEHMAPMNASRGRHNVGAAGGRLFAFGGRHGDAGEFTNTCEALDVSKNGAWEVVASMPTARYDVGVAVVGGRIFAIGGYNGSALDCVEVLDTKECTWTTFPAPMPTPRQGMGIVVVDERFIWTFGGLREGHGYLDVIEVLDVEKQTWSTPAVRMTKQRYSSKAVLVDRRVFIVGGSTGSIAALVEVLDLDTLTWGNAADLASPRKWHAAVGF